MNEPSFDFIKTDIFNFPVCKIYLGTWVRRARGHVEHSRHVGTESTWARWARHLADSIEWLNNYWIENIIE